MGRSIQINTCSLDSFEGLHQAIQGTRVEVTQLGRGRFRGSLSHVGIGDFSLSIGSFSVGVRTQRIATDDKLVIGMLPPSQRTRDPLVFRHGPCGCAGHAAKHRT